MSKIIPIKFDTDLHKATIARIRADDFAMRKGYRLLGTSSYKIDKSNQSKEYHTAILYLAPADSVNGINLCPMADLAGCKTGCLNTAGRGAMNNVQAARMRKTELYRDTPDKFWEFLKLDIAKFQRYCVKRGLKPVVRINGTSDIVIEKKQPSIFTDFPDVQFYDYTKIAQRNVSKIPNYHLTYSYSGAYGHYAAGILKNAKRMVGNIAVVFRNAASIPATFEGLPVVDGDSHDMRFLDPSDQSYAIALTAKGRARHDTSGFVIG